MFDGGHAAVESRIEGRAGLVQLGAADVGRRHPAATRKPEPAARHRRAVARGRLGGVHPPDERFGEAEGSQRRLLGGVVGLVLPDLEHTAAVPVHRVPRRREGRPRAQRMEIASAREPGQQAFIG
ncbi:hypothetical protein D3C87_1181460 [compost metagenome]